VIDSFAFLTDLLLGEKEGYLDVVLKMKEGSGKKSVKKVVQSVTYMLARGP
jgi:hypothetical protein